MTPAVLTAGNDHPAKAFPHEQPNGGQMLAGIASYGAFNNPDYYYAPVKVAPASVYYRQTSFNPSGTKLIAQEDWTDTVRAPRLC